MTLAMLKPYWAPLLALALALMVALVIAVRSVAGSSGSLLAAASARLRQCQREARKAERRCVRMRRRFEGLKARRDAVKPRVLEAAEGAYADAEALLKIRGDQVLVAQNQLRTVIVQEYPPDRHDAMRNRYLPGLALK